MANSKPEAANGGEPSSATDIVKPVASFGDRPDATSAVSGTGSSTTVRFRCRVTLKNCMSLFGGAEDGGSIIGAADGSNDIVLEVEGEADLGDGGFGAAEDGGDKIGHGDVVAGDETQRQSYTSQSDRAGGGSAGAKAD